MEAAVRTQVTERSSGARDGRRRVDAILTESDREHLGRRRCQRVGSRRMVGLHQLAGGVPPEDAELRRRLTGRPHQVEILAVPTEELRQAVLLAAPEIAELVIDAVEPDAGGGHQALREYHFSVRKLEAPRGAGNMGERHARRTLVTAGLDAARGHEDRALRQGQANHRHEQREQRAGRQKQAFALAQGWT